MKKSNKLLLTVGAVLLLILATGGFVLFRHASTVKNTYVYTPTKKKTVEFGTYPQSRVTDNALIEKLNELPVQWISYGYYNGTGDFGSERQSDYMQYADVTYQDNKYRGVRISEYRSYCCHQPAEISWQKTDHGLMPDTVYWFQFDPIRWIVLSEKEGFLLSEAALDAQPLNSVIFVDHPEKSFDKQKYYKDEDLTIYATDYYTSDLRSWLNGSFFETAFSEGEAQRILVTSLDNSAWNQDYAEFGSQNSNDRVFLLSYAEATNPDYGFCPQAEKTDPLRTAFPTDYALCQGAWAVHDHYKNGAVWWWFRTGGTNSTITCGPNFYGSICFSLKTPYSPDCTDTAVRPAIKIKPIG